MSHTEWAVERATTEKLEERLNSTTEAGREVEKIQYLGGRDWVIISFRDLAVRGGRS